MPQKYWRSILSNWPNCSQNKRCVLLNFLLLHLAVFSAHKRSILDELGNVSCMFVSFPLFFVWNKQKGSHLSISHPKSFRTRQLDMPGYKGFSFWLVLLFSKEHGVGCFSFPKFFLPWYVCFWGNSSSLTLGMFDTMDCFCKTKGFKGAPQTKTWPVQQFLCNGWIKLSHLLSGTFTLSWFYQSLLNSQYNWMTDDITWHC